MAGMAQVQSQLATLTIQLQELAKGKEKCMKKSGVPHAERKGHHKNECPTFREYLATGALNPLAPGGGVYCEICRTMGHHPTSCPLMQKYQST
jgi:hypothetical protein